MTPRVDVVNRVLLTIVGIVLLLGGLATLLLGLGAFGGYRSDLPVIDDRTREVVDGGRPWLWPVIGGVCVIAAILLIWWLVAQLATRRLPRIDVERTPAGTTRLVTGALASAVAAAAMELDGVARARGRVLSRRSGHELELTVWLEPPYDVPSALRELQDRVVADARTAVGDPHLAVRVHIEADLVTPARVH